MLDVLLVEDDEIDAEAFRRLVTKRFSFCRNLHHCTDGAAALEFLSQHDFSSQSVPMVIALDLNMPGMNGISFLQELRASPYKSLPVYMLSSSKHPRDIQETFSLNVAGYFCKVQLAALLKLLEILDSDGQHPVINVPTIAAMTAGQADAV